MKPSVLLRVFLFRGSWWQHLNVSVLMRALAVHSTSKTGENDLLLQSEFMNQKQTGSQPAFYHNKGKHTKSPEHFSAIKTPTPSPASISGCCALSVSPSNSPLLSATPRSPSHSVTTPPDAFPPSLLLHFSLFSCHSAFIPYSLALVPSLLLLHDYLPPPPPHMHRFFSFF